MQPLFRNDLRCSREEQQGVVFYRIDDLETQTSFRLYEIEYLIAQKLDGQRTIPEVVTAVKNDYNFDISEADLDKFVSQLESMGFVRGQGAAGGGHSAGGQVVDAADDIIELEESEQDTAIMNVRDFPELELVEPVAAASAVDQAELTRLLRSALLHIKQGYVVHARDYILAARELNPFDHRLGRMVAHLEILDEATTRAEVEHLWAQAQELFPDIAEEVGPLTSEGTDPGTLSASAEKTTEAWDDDLRTRVIYFVAIIVLLLGGGAGIVWGLKQGRLFESAPQVRLQNLQAVRVPTYFESEPEVRPAKQASLSFGTSGKLEVILVERGQKVLEGDLLARLELAGNVAKQWRAAESAVTKAQRDFEKANQRLEKLLAERATIEAEQQLAQERLRELTPKSVLRQGGVSKRDVKKWTRIKAKTNKQLSAQAKKERHPRAQQQKSKRALDQAQKKAAAIEQRIAPNLLRAPFTGVIDRLPVVAGEVVGPKKEVALLKDNKAVLLSFAVDNVDGLQAGGEAHISVGSGIPSRGKISHVQAGAKPSVQVTLADPTGGFAGMAPKSFRLVREFVDPAFSVPRGAMFNEDGTTHVIVAVQNKALRRTVGLLDSKGSHVVIRDISGTLRDGQQLVVERRDGGALGTIAEGSALEIMK